MRGLQLFVPEGVDIFSIRNEDMMQSLGKVVRDKRKALGLTQPIFADKAGVGLRFFRELEAGKPTMRIDKVNQVLLMFGFELGPVTYSHFPHHLQ